MQNKVTPKDSFFNALGLLGCCIAVIGLFCLMASEVSAEKMTPEDKTDRVFVDIKFAACLEGLKISGAGLQRNMVYKCNKYSKE